MIAEYEVHGEETFIERNAKRGEGLCGVRDSGGAAGGGEVGSREGGEGLSERGTSRGNVVSTDVDDVVSTDVGEGGDVEGQGEGVGDGMGVGLSVEDDRRTLREGELSDMKKYDEDVLTTLPLYISRLYPLLPTPVGDFLMEDISLRDLEFLDLPIQALTAVWAPRRLSIVGKYDRRTYCFTHSYGRLYDRSSGSLFYKDAEGPLSEKDFAIDR